MLLHEFIERHRDNLIQRTRAKVAGRGAPRPTVPELTKGVPLFLTQLTEALKRESGGAQFTTPAIDLSAADHGGDLLKKGFSVDQVVHDYGDICQAITELAFDEHDTITTGDFHTLNRCLDNAIAGAVTEYSRQREQNKSTEDAVRRGMIAHEMRNLLASATMAFQMLRNGSVGIGGSTGTVLGRCLESLRHMVDRTVSEVRISAGLQQFARVPVSSLIEQEEVSAALDATARKISLTIDPVPAALAIEVDLMIVGSALANLLQNAIKFTKPSSHVFLRTRADGGRILIEVEDECGGLPDHKAGEMFLPVVRKASDRTGLGLGLTIAREGVQANKGTLSVRDLPGKGCVFTIDLPAVQPFA